MRTKPPCDRIGGFIFIAARTESAERPILAQAPETRKPRDPKIRAVCQKRRLPCTYAARFASPGTQYL